MTEKKGSRSVVVSLHDVVEEMDLPSDAWTAHLNRRTGELVTVTDEDQRLVEAGEDPEDLPEWQRETLPKVREALESDDFLALPGKFEIHEYRIMERFSLGVEDVGVREALLQAIRGRGAFRRFKEVIHECDVAEAWYAYRQQALEDIAVDWLEANGVAYSREKRPPSDDGAELRVGQTQRYALACRLIGVAACHSLSVPRFVPPITRLQRTVVHASTLAHPPAADPQRR